MPDNRLAKAVSVSFFLLAARNQNDTSIHFQSKNPAIRFAKEHFRNKNTVRIFLTCQVNQKDFLKTLCFDYYGQIKVIIKNRLQCLISFKIMGIKNSQTTANSEKM